MSCPECGGPSLLQDREAGELVCKDCGYVVSGALLDTSPEWRAFDHAQREANTRVGAPASWAIYDKGLSTSIGWQDRDAAGRSLSPEMRLRLNRLRRLHQRSKVSESSQRNLAHALSEMSKVCGALSLPRNVMETGGLLYRRAIQGGLTRGRAIQSVSVACLYLACRQCGAVRSLDDIAAASGIPRKEAGRTYRFLVKELRLAVPQVDPESHISKIVNRLALGGEAEMLAKVVLSCASDLRLTVGRAPQGLAAACVYIGCCLAGERRTQGEIAREAQVTEVTIRNRYKELLEYMEFTVLV